MSTVPSASRCLSGSALTPLDRGGDPAAKPVSDPGLADPTGSPRPQSAACLWWRSLPAAGAVLGTPWALRAGLAGTYPLRDTAGARDARACPPQPGATRRVPSAPGLAEALCPPLSQHLHPHSASVLPTGCGGPSWVPSAPSRSRGAGVTWHWEAGALPHSHPGCDTPPSSPSSYEAAPSGRESSLSLAEPSP